MELGTLPFIRDEVEIWMRRLFWGLMSAYIGANLICYGLFTADLISPNTGLIVATIGAVPLAAFVGMLVFLTGVAIGQAIADLTAKGMTWVLNKLKR